MIQTTVTGLIVIVNQICIKRTDVDKKRERLFMRKMFSAYDMTQSSGSSGKRREFLDLLLSWERAFGNHHGGVTFRYTQDSEKRTVDIGTDIKNGVSKRNQGLAGRFTYNWNYRYFVCILILVIPDRKILHQEINSVSSRLFLLHGTLPKSHLLRIT